MIEHSFMLVLAAEPKASSPFGIHPGARLHHLSLINALLLGIPVHRPSQGMRFLLGVSKGW